MTGKATTQMGQLLQGGRGGRRRRPLKVGRETKLTPELSKRICDVVRAGNYVSVAARYCGVGEATLHEWIQRGRGEHPTLSAARVYTEFADDLEAAEAGSEVTAVLHWRSAMPKDWHSSERWLRTRIPERWGDKEDASARQVAMQGVQVNISGLTGGISTQTAQGGLDQPISSLLEDNPHLIGGVMSILDQLLPIDAVKQENVLSDAETPENALIVANEAIDAVFDAESGTWVTKDDETT